MARLSVRTRIQSFDQTVGLAVSRALSPTEAGKLVAAQARRILADAEAQNAAILGRRPPHETFVDGRREAPLESVKLDHGSIVFRFQLIDDVLVYISEQLVRHAPVRSGRFSHSFALFADGHQVDINAPVTTDAKEWVFLNTQPYARKIENGLSPQAPEGVFDVIATMANNRFSNMAQVRFSYRSPILPYIPGARGAARKARKTNAGHVFAAQAAERATRTPCIIVTPR